MMESEDTSKFAKWTTAEVNDFPDSSFAHIFPGGKKDEEGKTVPRSLRVLPYKDASGKVDLPHVRNALARANQVIDPKTKSRMPESWVESIQRKLRAILEKETKASEEPEKKPVSKYSTDSKTKLETILTTLKALAEKTEEVIELKKEDIATMIADLEAVYAEASAIIEEKKEEAPKIEDKKPEVKIEDKKPEVEVKVEDKKPETEIKTEPQATPEVKDGADTSEAKPEVSDDNQPNPLITEEIEKESAVAKYKAIAREALEEAEKINSKYKETKAETESLKLKLVEAESQISKFEQREYEMLLDDTLEKVSKFRSYSKEEKLAKRQEWMNSKLSKETLKEIGKEISAMHSKFESEPAPITKPSSELKAPETASESSKFKTSEDALNEVINNAAKKAGWKGPYL